MQIKEVNKIREQYISKTESQTKLDTLKKLDAKVKRPAEIFGYTFGTVGTLVLGVGMCLALKVIGNILPLGVVVGVVGIAMISANYFIYNHILKRNKAKYAKEIVALSDDILNENVAE